MKAKATYSTMMTNEVCMAYGFDDHVIFPTHSQTQWVRAQPQDSDVANPCEFLRLLRLGEVRSSSAHDHGMTSQMVSTWAHRTILPAWKMTAKITYLSQAVR